MVEKIIINPTKVRAYGNIINQHSTADYTNYACTLTEETDTINGQTMPVYEMEDTILFWDKAVTGMKNTNWQNYSSRLNISTDENGTLLSKGSSNGFYYVKNADKTFTNCIIEFDIISCLNVFWYLSGQSSTTQNLINLGTYYFNGGHCKIIMNNGVAKAYLDGEQVGNDITITATSPYGMGFRINAGDETREIKYKNFIVYGLSSSS